MSNPNYWWWPSSLNRQIKLFLLIGVTYKFLIIAYFHTIEANYSSVFNISKFYEL